MSAHACRSSHVRIPDHEELWQPAWGVRTGAFLRHSELPALDLFDRQLLSDCRVSFLTKVNLLWVWGRWSIRLQSGNGWLPCEWSEIGRV